VEQLISLSITPIMVFDGQYLPSKEQTEQDRETTRRLNRKKGEECIRRGEKDLAGKYFALSIDVTDEMAEKFIRVLRQRGVECILAPYEADS
jgi:exonuclease 1